MLAKHVEAKVFQHLEVIFHSLTVRWRVQTVWPVSLVKGAELEYELSVEQGTLDTVNFTPAHSPECSVAVDDIVAESDADIVQRRRVWRPQLGAFGFEGECSVGAAAATCELTAICVEDLDLDVRCPVVGGVDSSVYFKRLVGLKT